MISIGEIKDILGMDETFHQAWGMVDTGQRQSAEERAAKTAAANERYRKLRRRRG